MLDGEPLTSGYVMALPTKGRMARAAIQPDGSFTFGTYSDSDGVQIGTHAVTVSPVPSDEGSSRAAKQTRPIPRKYSQARGSGLTLTVEAGGTDSYLIELESGE